MQTQAKVVRSKPQVSLMRATGTLILKADDLADAALLTALFRMLLHGQHEPLRKALVEAGRAEALRMSDGESFTMIPPRRTGAAGARKETRRSGDASCSR